MTNRIYKCLRCDALVEYTDGEWRWCPVCGCGGMILFELDKNDDIKSSKLELNIKIDYVDGYQKGYDEGYIEGYDRGYNDAIEEMKVMLNETM